MRCHFSHKIKISSVFLVFIFALIVVFIWQKYPFGVKQYKTIILGMPAAEKVGDSTGWAPPDDYVPESYFYVYALGDQSFCIGPSCGLGGSFVECLGGWISGYKIAGDTFDYGLDDESINSGKEKVITIADKRGKVVGIYPGARIRNLPYIMRSHRDLVSNDVFEGCSDLLPWRWK